MLASYLDDLKRRQKGSRPGAAIVKTTLTRVLEPSERRKAIALAQTMTPLQLHLGCGDTYLEGWVNIDLARPGRKLDIRWDLARGLPLPSNSADAVFSEHLFEHLPLHGAVALARESFRVLKPTGIFRVAVPNLGRYISSYVGEDTLIDDYRPGRPCPALALNEIFYLYEHRTMYDYDLMRLILQESGFKQIAESSFGVSRISPCPDSESRRVESLYVEAIKG